MLFLRCESFINTISLYQIRCAFDVCFIKTAEICWTYTSVCAMSVDTIPHSTYLSFCMVTLFKYRQFVFACMFCKQIKFLSVSDRDVDAAVVGLVLFKLSHLAQASSKLTYREEIAQTVCVSIHPFSSIKFIYTAPIQNQCLESFYKTILLIQSNILEEFERGTCWPPVKCLRLSY